MGLLEASEQLFIYANKLQTSNSMGGLDSLLRELLMKFDQMEQAARSEGIATRDIEDAKYALAGFLDEMILTSTWEHKDQWLGGSLQMQFFGEHMAGVEFFTRLDRVRKSARSLTNGLLDVYFYCMVFGFEGKYRLQQADERRILIDEIGKEIFSAPSGDNFLSPSWQRSDDGFDIVTRETPLWVIAALALGVASVSYAVLTYWLGSFATGLSESLLAML